MKARSAMRRRVTAGMASAAVIAATGVAVVGSAPVAAGAKPQSACHLGNGVKHVVSIVFDNVHFFRDNPNVPSDLEQMPHLLNFLKSNGTVLSNVHTPLIAHTADDSLTIYTGLYGDRHGQPLSNSYKTYNPDGTTDPAALVRLLDRPGFDTASPPTAGHDTHADHGLLRQGPGHAGRTDKQTPAPWVPFTRAGCTVGDFSTANMVLENTALTCPTVFGPDSPEVAQSNADPDSFKDAEIADYVGERRALREGRRDLRERPGGEVRPDDALARPRSPDSLPTEPGGYDGFQALFGAKYVAPQFGAGTPNLTHNGYQVTNAAGQPRRPQRQRDPGAVQRTSRASPASTRPRRSRLAYLADMQEAGIPVTYGYISDLHERKAARHAPARPRPPPAPASRSGPATTATSRTPRTTTPRSRSSSSGWPATASRRPTPSSSSAPRRTTSSPAPTSGGPPNRPRPAATASPRRAPTPPARSVNWRRTSRACSRRRPAAARRSTSSRRAPRSTSTASRPQTTRRCVNSNATPPR